MDGGFRCGQARLPALQDRTIFRQNQAIMVKLNKTLVTKGF
jgi:hypothetical protein